MNKSEKGKVKREQIEENEGEDKNDARGLEKIRLWMKDFEVSKFLRMTEKMTTSLIESWSKLRITILKLLNEQQNYVLGCVERMRKQAQWLTTVYNGQLPEINKMTSKLYQDCELLIDKGTNFKLKQIYKQSQLVTNKILNTTKIAFAGVKEKLNTVVSQIKSIYKFKELLEEKTYFSFEEKQHHSEIELISEIMIGCLNESHDTDFGAVIGPALTKYNPQIGFRIDRNDKFQSYIGLGVCHPNLVKDQNYRGSGPNSGSYMIQQNCNSSQAIALNHADEREGSRRRQKSIGWGFGVGDIVVVQIDFENERVCFRKNESYFKMAINFEDGPIHPYVVLHSKWDNVSIINS